MTEHFAVVQYLHDRDTGEIPALLIESRGLPRGCAEALCHEMCGKHLRQDIRVMPDDDRSIDAVLR